MWQTYTKHREAKVLEQIRQLGAGEGCRLSEQLDVLQITLNYYAPTLIVAKALRGSKPHKRVIGYFFDKNPLKVHELMQRAELPYSPDWIGNIGALFKAACILKIYSVIGHYAVRHTPDLLAMNPAPTGWVLSISH